MTTTITAAGLTVTVPELEHDRMMLAKFGHAVQPRGRLERRIVAALIAHLDAYDFMPTYVHDGEDTTRVTNAKEAMELIFNLDEASLHFQPKRTEVLPAREDMRGYTGFDNEHGVLLILGNGVDVISDWNYGERDLDGFNKAMEAFNAEDFA
jgi:hypothetical protein